MIYTDLEKTILKTLAYYQAMGDMPLTLVEVQKYLYVKEGAHEYAPLFNIQGALDILKNNNIVSEYIGFWSLYNNKKLLKKRAQNTKFTTMKWKILKKRGRFLPYIPYIKSVSVTGSIALNNADENSDIDILIKTKKDEIWTTRFLTTIISFILGARRHRKKINNRLCFNQYVEENNKNFGPKNVNQIIKNIRIPIWGNGASKYDSIFYLKTNYPLLLLKKTTELVLRATLIDKLAEIIFGKFQINKIKHNPIQYPKELGALKISSKNIIFYYPKVHSTEKKYTQLIKNLSQEGQVF